MKHVTRNIWFTRGQRMRKRITRPLRSARTGLDHTQSGIRGFFRGLILNKEPTTHEYE